MSEHETTCPLKDIECDKCHVPLKRNMLSNHYETCPEVVVTKFFKFAGMNLELPRRTLNSLNNIEHKLFEIDTSALTSAFAAASTSAAQMAAMIPVSQRSEPLSHQQKILAELEFPANEVLDTTATYLSKNRNAYKNLLAINTGLFAVKFKPYSTIHPTSGSFHSVSFFIVRYLKDKQKEFSDNFGLYASCFSDIPDIQAGEYQNNKKVIMATDLNLAQDNLQKEYLLTLYGCVEDERVLSEFRLSVKDILLYNDVSSHGFKNLDAVPMQMKRFYRFFTEGFPGGDFIKRYGENARFRMVVSEVNEGKNE